MNDEIKTAVSITFTTAELWVMLEMIGVPEMVGVEQLPESEQAVGQEMGQRTLQARNLLTEENELDDVAQAVLAAAFASPKLIAIAPLYQETAVRQPIYCYLGEAYHMIHARESGGRHQFSLLPNNALLTQALQHMLKPLLVGDADYPTVDLPINQFEAVGIVGLEQGAEAAAAQLLQAKASADLAQALGATLAEATYTAVSLIDFAAGEAATQQLILLHGAGQAWLVQRSSDTNVTVRSTTLTAVEAWLADFMMGREASVDG